MCADIELDCQHQSKCAFQFPKALHIKSLKTIKDRGISEETFPFVFPWIRITSFRIRIPHDKIYFFGLTKF